MAKNNRKARRQRAIAARQHAASPAQGSFIANELRHLIDADEESVVRAFRWRAKVNVYMIYGFNFVAFLYLLHHTNSNQGGLVSQYNPYVWACFIGFFIVP